MSPRFVALLGTGVLVLVLGCKQVEKPPEPPISGAKIGAKTTPSRDGPTGGAGPAAELPIPASELDAAEPPALPTVVARPRPNREPLAAPTLPTELSTVARPSSDRSGDEFRDARVGDFVLHRLGELGTLRRELLAVGDSEIRERQTRQARDDSPPVVAELLYQFSLPAEPVAEPAMPAPPAAADTVEELSIGGRTLSCRVRDRRVGERRDGQRGSGRVWLAASVPLGGLVRLTDADGRVLSELLDWGRK